MRLGCLTLTASVVVVALVANAMRMTKKQTAPLRRAAMAAAADTENPACGPTRFRWTDNAYVEVILDSSAVQANRVTITVLRDSTRPLQARLQASTGAVECQQDTSGLQFRVHDAQSLLSLLVHSPTPRAVVNVRLTDKGRWLKTGSYAADGTPQEAVWEAGLESIVNRDKVARDNENARRAEERRQAIERDRAAATKRLKPRSKRP